MSVASRERCKRKVEVDKDADAWARARAWALWQAVKGETPPGMR